MLYNTTSYYIWNDVSHISINVFVSNLIPFLLGVAIEMRTESNRRFLRTLEWGDF